MKPFYPFVSDKDFIYSVQYLFKGNILTPEQDFVEHCSHASMLKLNR